MKGAPTKGVTRTGAERQDCERTKFWRNPWKRVPKVQTADPRNLSGKRTEHQYRDPGSRSSRGSVCFFLLGEGGDAWRLPLTDSDM